MEIKINKNEIMKRFIITEEEKNTILGMYKKDLLNEDIFSMFVGALSKFARKAIVQSEDDLIRAFKTTEVALAKNIDEIVEGAIKSGKMDDIQTLEAKLIHAFDPSGKDPAMAKEQTIKFLNSYAKSKGNTGGWKDIRAKAQPSTGASSSAVKSTMAGQRVSNRWYMWKPENIDFSKFSVKMSFDELNKQIAEAIKTKNWNLVPRGGFEKFGITNFREYLQNNIAQVNEVIPETGRWSVIFK